MGKIGDRYITERLVVTLDGGKLYTGKDLSLQRNVLLHLSESGEDSRTELISAIGAASGIADERFLHILDVGTDGDTVYCVLQLGEGMPLMQAVRGRKFKVSEALPLVCELGRGVQYAMEQRILDFDVSAENVWYADGQLKLIDYWTVGKRESRGAAGLCRLIYQMCVEPNSSRLPDSFESYRNGLNRALDLPPQLHGAFWRMAEKALEEKGALSAFMPELQDLAEAGSVLQTEEAHPQELVADLPDHNDGEKVLTREIIREKRPVGGKWLLAGSALLCFALVFVLVGWLLLKPSDETDRPAVPAYSTADDSSSPDVPAEGVVDNRKPAKAGKGESTVSKPQPNSSARQNPPAKTAGPSVIPKLVGLSQKEAEQSALAAGVHYQYFLEADDAPQGTVFKQEPAPGTKAANGDQVTFWVSKGK